MKIGYHLSMSKGLKVTADEAKLHKLGAVQIFPGSPRSYFPSNHTNENIQAMKHLNIPKFVHINYYVNLASDKAVLPKSLAENLNFCDAIGSSGLVIHMGSNKDREEGIKNTLYNLKRAYQKTNAKTRILIESTAEGGNRLNLNDIIEFIDNNPELNLGMCFDTCHAYSAGYSSKDIVNLIGEHHKIIGLVHLNNPNPEVEIGKHLDRHNISLFDKDGKFSKIEIENMMSISNLHKIPMILETGDYMENDVIFINENYQNF